MKEKLVNNKKLFITILASFVLLIGMSFAIYNITLEGQKNHSIKTNKLTFSYKEPQDALNFLAYDSYTDDEGKNLKNFYEIKVKATSEAREVIDYVIYLQKEETEKMYNPSDLKLYLTKVVNGVEQEVVAPTLVSNFTEYNNIMDTLAIYGDSFSFETNNNEVKETTYRLRIWLKDGFDFNKLATSVNTNGEQNIKLESYEFKFKVNVATGVMPNIGAMMLVAKANPEDLDYDSATAAQKLEMWTHSHPATSQTGALTDYRYIGANPNNYITFNNETWRIIGVFTVDDGTGNLQQRIKITRNESIGNYSWDNKRSGTGSSTSDNGSNEWDDSKLQVMLNSGAYYNHTSGSCPSGGMTDDLCNFASTGLTDKAKSYIDNAVYYLGGSSTNTATASSFYSYERGNTRYDNTRKLSWMGKIGLIYASDYGYATSGGTNGDRTTCLGENLSNWISSPLTMDCAQNDWLYKTGSFQWTIVPDTSDSYYAYRVGDVDNTGKVRNDQVASANGIFPVAYLKSNIQLEGTGSSTDHYVIIN